jgi:hypothetical protein
MTILDLTSLNSPEPSQTAGDKLIKCLPMPNILSIINDRRTLSLITLKNFNIFTSKLQQRLLRYLAQSQLR